jgi:hypothetical protein
MGLRHRPTPGKKRRTDDWPGPAGRARTRAHSQKTNLRLRRPKGAACIRGRDAGRRCRAEVGLHHRGLVTGPDQGQQHRDRRGLQAGLVAAGWIVAAELGAPGRPAIGPAHPAAGHSSHAHRSRPPRRLGGRSPPGSRTRPAAHPRYPGGVAGGPTAAGSGRRWRVRWPRFLVAPLQFSQPATHPPCQHPRQRRYPGGDAPASPPLRSATAPVDAERRGMSPRGVLTS